MNCVILQPSYIPWRGYFHQIWKADCFVFYDDVQYDRRGWRNRNRIKTAQGCRWLSVPVHAKGCRQLGTPIRDVRICPDTSWQTKHWHTLEQSYGHAPYFSRYAPRLQEFYRARWDYLCDLDIALTQALALELGIRDTRFLRASGLKAAGAGTDRLLSILKQIGATHYITGPSAGAYLDEEEFEEAGITLEYMRYDYAEYEQLHPPYDGRVSVLDLLFMKGPGALDWIVKPHAGGCAEPAGATLEAGNFSIHRKAPPEGGTPYAASRAPCL